MQVIEPYCTFHKTDVVLKAFDTLGVNKKTLVQMVFRTFGIRS